MSTDKELSNIEAPGFPEFGELGHIIENRRIARRLTKRALAHYIGISRQQLWRIMTGKSELTPVLQARLAEILDMDARALAAAGNGAPGHAGEDGAGPAAGAGTPRRPSLEVDEHLSFADYIADRDAIVRTFRTLPMSAEGRWLKRALLNAIEDLAAERDIEVPAVVFELRREVIGGSGPAGGAPSARGAGAGGSRGRDE
jgi:transcriptional regulator with XRE-family HTH domain